MRLDVDYLATLYLLTLALLTLALLSTYQVRSDADYTATLIENTRAQLLSDFDTWLQVCYLVITPLSYLSRTWAPGYRQALRICICCITIFSNVAAGGDGLRSLVFASRARAVA